MGKNQHAQQYFATYSHYIGNALGFCLFVITSIHTAIHKKASGLKALPITCSSPPFGPHDYHLLHHPELY